MVSVLTETVGCNSLHRIIGRGREATVSVSGGNRSLAVASHPCATHDLLRIRHPRDIVTDVPLPSWVAASLSNAPFVVVRRASCHNGRIPIGIRGQSRSQRFAAVLPADAVVERTTPEDLTRGQSWRISPRRDRIPALAALDRVADGMARFGLSWGPGGSAGFELASGVPTATLSSDLDLVLRAPHRIAPSTAAGLLAAQANLPVRLDVLLETPAGGVLLRDYLACPRRVLLRTVDGPMLVEDPWDTTMSTGVLP